MVEDLTESLREENEVLRGEVRVAREAAEITSQLVAKQFEETDRLIMLFQDANSQRQAVLDAATSVAIIAADMAGKVTLFNSGAENLLGYKVEEALGRDASRILGLDAAGNPGKDGTPQGQVGLEEAFEEFFRSGGDERPLDREWTFTRKDGSRFPATLSVSRLKGPDGEVTGLLFVAMDITERKKAERNILEAMRAAEAANRTKSAFLANMSHELRTPLNAIIGYSEMLQEEAEDIGQDDFIPDLKKIRAAGKHLLSLINDVLDLSKIEAGKMDLFLEDFDVSHMVEDVATTVHPLIEKNSNTLKVNCPKDIGRIHADLTRVRQVLFNLLSNASKFTDKGEVTIEASREARGGADWIIFRVKDSGIGMTEEQIGRLFQAFSQADASTTRKFGGTGLGLAISLKFCEMMGGKISVTSEPGKGSTFTMEIPAVVTPVKEEDYGQTAGPAPKAAPSPVVAPRSHTVLVVDDDTQMHELMTRHLKRDGYTVVAASSGQEGLRLAREIRPVAITLDVMMPGMDGWAVLRELKTDPELKDIPVIMMTMVEDKTLGYALGASDYLTKPVDRGHLLGVLNKHRDACQSGSVLVVDDDPINRELVCDLLKKAGVTVCEAKNGRVAIEMVEINRPCMILLDLMMPEMDGFEFVDEMRMRPELGHVPIIVLTAKDLTGEDMRRLDGGVRNILQKGAYSRDELMRQVCEQVSRSIPASTK